MRVAMIFARGGSVRVPFKNGRVFRGKPMLCYPIEAARASKLFDLIVVSTDDQTIADIAFRAGCVVVPRAPDDGSTGTQELAGRLLDQLDVHGGIAAVIYPCTPMLRPEDLQDAYKRMLQPDALNKPFVRSVCPDGEDAGAFYLGWTLAFRSRKPLDAFTTLDYPLPAERCIDVNTWADWLKAEAMFDNVARGDSNEIKE